MEINPPTYLKMHGVVGTAPPVAGTRRRPWRSTWLVNWSNNYIVRSIDSGRWWSREARTQRNCFQEQTSLSVEERCCDGGHVWNGWELRGCAVRAGDLPLSHHHLCTRSSLRLEEASFSTVVRNHGELRTCQCDRWWERRGFQPASDYRLCIAMMVVPILVGSIQVRQKSGVISSNLEFR